MSTLAERTEDVVKTGELVSLKIDEDHQYANIRQRHAIGRPAVSDFDHASAAFCGWIPAMGA